MTLKERINADFMTAFKNKDNVRKTILGVLKASIQTQEKNAGQSDMSDEDVMKILNKQVKNLKEKGYQLKAIKHALNQVLKKDGKAQGELSDEILERDMSAALKEFKEEDSATSLSTVKGDGVSVVAMEEKMEQFQQIMNLIIGRALEVNNEKLSQDISCLVNEKMGKELEFLFQASDQKEEERFRQLDETLRSYQKGGQAEAAAAKVPFFKRRRFGRSGKKLRDGK